MEPLHNLNDMFLFARVVEHGGYSAAAKALGMQASLLSRHIAALETRLGVRLLNRTTRRISVTDAGQTFYGHCAAVVAEAQAAADAIDHTRSTPQGLVRFSCPQSMLQSGVGATVAAYLNANPLVRIAIEATNRRVDVVEEGLDFALRVRQPPLEDSDLVVRLLYVSRPMLVASPRLFDSLPRPASIEEAARLPVLSMGAQGDRHSWTILDDDGAKRSVAIVPRLAIDDLRTLRAAACKGLGLALLPMEMADADIAAGTLEQVLPQQRFPEALVHAAFASRRGLVPAVRGLLDALVEDFKKHPMLAAGGYDADDSGSDSGNNASA